MFKNWKKKAIPLCWNRIFSELFKILGNYYTPSSLIVYIVGNCCSGEQCCPWTDGQKSFSCNIFYYRFIYIYITQHFIFIVFLNCMFFVVPNKLYIEIYCYWLSLPCSLSLSLSPFGMLESQPDQHRCDNIPVSKNQNVK